MYISIYIYIYIYMYILYYLFALYIYIYNDQCIYIYIFIYTPYVYCIRTHSRSSDASPRTDALDPWQCEARGRPPWMPWRSAGSAPSPRCHVQPPAPKAWWWSWGRCGRHSSPRLNEKKGEKKDENWEYTW